MSFTIYAMRAKGELEVRYIGQTSKTPESRIYSESASARSRTKRPYLTADAFCHWLVEHEGAVEGIALAKVETRAEANAMERAMVVAFAKLGHRLFNRWLVPVEYRQAA